jgi:hypothetical protein
LATGAEDHEGGVANAEGGARRGVTARVASLTAGASRRAAPPPPAAPFQRRGDGDKSKTSFVGVFPKKKANLEEGGRSLLHPPPPRVPLPLHAQTLYPRRASLGNVYPLPLPLSLFRLTVMVICGAVFAVSTAFGGSEFTGQFTLASLGKGHRAAASSKSSSHHSSSPESGSHHSSPSSSSSSSSLHFSSSSLSKGDKVDSGAAAAVGSMTGKCQNIPADNAAGTFQFTDKRCAGSAASVPGCVVGAVQGAVQVEFS